MPVTIDGSNTPTAGGVVYGDGTEYASTSAGTSGQVLLSNGSSAPTWGTAGTATTATTATNLAGGSNGTIPYQSASGTTQMLAVGSAGQVLQTNGAGAPTWVTPGGGSWVYLSTVTASGAATADVETTFDSTYDMYAIVGVGIYPATDGVQLYCRLKVGGTYRTSNYACITYGVTVSTGSVLFNRSSAATAIQVNTDASGGYGTLNNEASTPGFLIMYVQKPSDSSIYQSVFGSYAYTPEDAGTNFTQGQFSGSYKSAVGALTGVRFLASSGNINGTFRLYGIKNS